jgi:hypothetical protein
MFIRLKEIGWGDIKKRNPDIETKKESLNTKLKN